VREEDAHAWIQSHSACVAAPIAERPRRLKSVGAGAAGSVAKLRQMEEQLTLDHGKSV